MIPSVAITSTPNKLLTIEIRFPGRVEPNFPGT